MGSQPPALGACYFGNAPDLGHYYIECAILELVGFLFNAHLFIFLGFSVCGTRRAKWMFVSPVSRFEFAHCEWILRQLQIARLHSNLVISWISKLKMDVVSWEEIIPESLLVDLRLIWAPETLRQFAWQSARLARWVKGEKRLKSDGSHISCNLLLCYEGVWLWPRRKLHSPLDPLVDSSYGVRCKHRNNSHSNTIVNYKILFCLEQELMAVEIVIMQVPTSKVLLASKTKGWHVVLNMESTLRLVFCRSQDCDLLQESASADDCAQYLQLTSFTWWHVGKKIRGKFGINSPYFEENIAEFTIF